MTRLFNNPAAFTGDMLDGFLDANARYVVGVQGGVVRAATTPPGKVAVVVGGDPATIPRSAVWSAPASPTVPSSATSSPHRRPARRHRSPAPHMAMRVCC